MGLIIDTRWATRLWLFTKREEDGFVSRLEMKRSSFTKYIGNYLPIGAGVLQGDW